MPKNIISSFQKFQEQRYKNKIKKHPYPTQNKFHLGSFTDAINGLIWTLKTQPNFAVELIACVLLLYAVVFFAYLGINFSIVELMLLIITCFIVLIFELLNTAIESLGDEVAKGEYKDFIRIAKDTSASGVLLASILWGFVVLLTFIPKLYNIQNSLVVVF